MFIDKLLFFIHLRLHRREQPIKPIELIVGVGV